MVERVERVGTGVAGLDDLIEGGLKRGSITLVAGPTGTLKTIFSTQYIVGGARDFGETGIFITLEERVSGIKESLPVFNEEMRRLEAEKKVHLLDLSSLRKKKPQFGESKMRYTITIDVLIDTIKKLIQKYNAQRLVIDSISVLGLLYKNQSDMRDDLFILMDFLRETGLTTLLITEIEEEFKDVKVSRFGIEEFLADGVIHLGYTRTKGVLRRWVSIRKMRFTDHNLDMHPIRLTEKGVEIVSAEKIY